MAAAAAGGGDNTGDKAPAEAVKPEDVPPPFPSCAAEAREARWAAELREGTAPAGTHTALIQAKADDVWPLLASVNAHLLWPCRALPESMAVAAPEGALPRCVGSVRLLSAPGEDCELDDETTRAGAKDLDEEAREIAGHRYRVWLTGIVDNRDRTCRSVEFAWQRQSPPAAESCTAADGVRLARQGLERVEVVKCGGSEGGGDSDNGVTHVSWTTWLQPESEERIKSPLPAHVALRNLKQALGLHGDSVRLSLLSASLPDETGDGTAAEAEAGCTTRVLDVKRNEWVARSSSSLRVGDVCTFESGDTFPADILLVWSTSPTETVVQTEIFDGSKDLRRREVATIPSLDVPIDGSPDAGASEADDAGAGAASSDEAMARALAGGPVACPVCTVNNDPFDTACIVCGTPLAGASGGGEPAKKPFDLLGTGFGTGDEATGGLSGTSAGARALRAIRAAGTLEIPPPRLDGELKVVFEPSDGSAKVKYEYKQLLPAGGRLLLTERVIGVVMQVGARTQFKLRGGAVAAGVRKRGRELSKRVEKAHKRAKEDRELASLAAGRDPAEYETATGIAWNKRFTNVPDDGNCGMHAFWLGLSTLLRHYPRLALEDEPALATTPEQFRMDALERLSADTKYRDSLERMMRLWLQLEPSMLQSMEDFFTLNNVDMQTMLLKLNQQVKTRGFDGVDIKAVGDAYLENMRTKQHVGGRDVFVPLGEIELNALCRLYDVRLETVKSEALELAAKALAAKKRLHATEKGGAAAQSAASGAGGGEQATKVKAEEIIDPRTIRGKDVHVVGSHASKRVVRLLNRDSNHYLVHLPCPPRE